MSVPSPAGGTPAGVPPVLVLVSDGCPACARVPAIIDDVRRLLPEARLTIVNIANQDLPDGVPFVGTPTYLIEDRIVSMGNPDPEDLAYLIAGWRSRAG